MVEIGKREKVGKRYVSRIASPAFLAPDIVEQIVKSCSLPNSRRNLCSRSARNFRSPGKRSTGRLDSLWRIDPSHRWILVVLSCRNVPEAFVLGVVPRALLRSLMSYSYENQSPPPKVEKERISAIGLGTSRVGIFPAGFELTKRRTRADFA
jgi:hypothetical protein